MRITPPPQKFSQGYTLIEVMLVVALLGTLLTLGPGLLTQTTRWFQQNKARINIQREARDVLDIVNRNLRQAQVDTVIVDQLSGQPPYSRITFTRLTPSSTKTISFYQQGKTLYLVDGGTKAISRNLRYLGFAYPRTEDGTIISVSITTEAGTYEGQTKALQLSVEKVRIMNP